MASKVFPKFQLMKLLSRIFPIFFTEQINLAAPRAVPVAPKRRPIRQEQCWQNKKAEYMTPRGKVAIITGGTAGIGLATAVELLKHGAHRVVLASNVKRDGEVVVKELNHEFGKGRTLYIPTDVTNATQLEEVFEETFRRFKRLDIVFNNAGMLEDRQWECEMETNVNAVIRGTVLAFKYMGKEAETDRKGGQRGIVINNASVMGMQAMPSAPVYSITKHAVIGSVKNFGDRFFYKKTGVRVVGLCPGVTATSMKENFPYFPDKEEYRRPETVGEPFPQRCEVAARAVTYLVRYAPTSTVWIIENSQLLLADIPDRRDYSKHVATFK